MKFLKKYKFDIILISSLILIGGLIIYIISLSSPGKYVAVRVNGEVKATFPLDTDLEYEIMGESGSINILKIKDGRAQIESASCPDKLCVNSGSVKYVGQSVICLPNKVVIEILSEKEDRKTDVDAG